MKAFAFQHNGVTCCVTAGDDGKVRAYRTPKRSMSPVDGDISSTAAMHEVLRLANPLQGNVSPDTRIALEGAMAAMLANATGYTLTTQELAQGRGTHSVRMPG